MTAVPPYLRSKATLLPEGHDESLDPSEAPTDAARRTVAPSRWPRVNRALGPRGRPDAPAGPPGTDPLARSLAPFSWPEYLGGPPPDLDPDLALWPGILLTRWPFTGPPTTGIWPLGWLGVDNTATLWVCTVGGQPGTWVAVGGPGGGGVAGVYNVMNFGATGNGHTDDTAAILAAIAAAAALGVGAGGGGVVYFPPGTYLCSAQLAYYPGQRWQGAVAGASTIVLANDLYTSGVPAARFIVPAAGAPDFYYEPFQIANLWLRGPGWGNGRGIGYTPCRTNGFVTSDMGGITLSDVVCSGWFAGVEEVADHTRYVRVVSENNYYGITFSDAASTSGNQSFYSCILTSNNLASVHVSGANLVLGTSWVLPHLGWGPVGLLKTGIQDGWDANNNPTYNTNATQAGFVASSFMTPTFENIGNCAILDIAPEAAPYATFSGCDFSRLAGLGMNPATYGTTLAPLNVADYQGAWCINIRGSDMNTMLRFYQGIGGAGGSGPPSVGSIKVRAPDILAPTIEQVSAPPTNLLGSAGNWSNAAQGNQRVLLVGAGSQMPGGECYVYQVAGTGVVNIGDVVELASGSWTVQRASGTKAPFGIALTASPGAANVPILVLQRGMCLANPASGIAALTAGAPLYLNATTPYLLDGTSSTNPLFGQLGANSAASPTSLPVKFNLL